MDPAPARLGSLLAAPAKELDLGRWRHDIEDNGCVEQAATIITEARRQTRPRLEVCAIIVTRSGQGFQVHRDGTQILFSQVLAAIVDHLGH